MKRLFLTVVALMGATTLFAQSEVVVVFQQGLEKAKAGQYESAVEDFLTVVDLSYDLVSEEPNDTKAIAQAKKFIVTCYNKLGNASAMNKDFESAIGHFTNAANYAELYEDIAAHNKNKTLIGQVYEAQGAEAFNAGDYTTAIEVFSKGYEADPRNTGMALNLAESYFRSNMYQDGMRICAGIMALNSEKNAEAQVTAQEKMDMYTNNEVAKLQQANNYDGIIALAEQLDDQAMAQKVIMQAYYGKKNFSKMIEISNEAIEAQTTDEGRSDIYYLLGVAYNELGQFDNAIAAMNNVTAGNNVANAQAVIETLSANKQ